MTDRKPGRPVANPETHKTKISIRLSPAVIEYFRTIGPGWQTRIDDILKRYVTRKKIGQ